MSPVTVVFEGNLGAGKTTLLEHWKQDSHLSDILEVVEEPVDKWTDFAGQNLLSLWHQDMARYSLIFQSLAQVTHLENHLKTVSKPVKVMERSVWSARKIFVEDLYKEKQLTSMEYELLDHWFKVITGPHVPGSKIDLVVYFRAKPSTCMDRVRYRAREEEEVMEASYLERIHKLYEKWLIEDSDQMNAKVIVLDADMEWNEVLEQSKVVIDTINELITMS